MELAHSLRLNFGPLRFRPGPLCNGAYLRIAGFFCIFLRVWGLRLPKISSEFGIIFHNNLSRRCLYKLKEINRALYLLIGIGTEWGGYVQVYTRHGICICTTGANTALHFYHIFCRTGLNKTIAISEDCKRLQVKLVSLQRAIFDQDACINLKAEIDGNHNLRLILQKLIIFHSFFRLFCIDIF